MSHPTPPSTPHQPYKHDSRAHHSNFTGENMTVFRDDIQNLVDVGTPVSDMATILLGKGLSQTEVDKIISDLGSYA